MPPTTQDQEDHSYDAVVYEDRPGGLFVLASGIRFQSYDNSIGLILVKDNLVNVSATSFECQKQYLLTITSFIHNDDSVVSVFHMASGVDLIHAKDSVDALLATQKGTTACRAEKLAERQEAEFYAF